MANVNSYGGEYNLPQMNVSDTNAHVVLVPNINTAVSGLSWSKPYYASAFPSNANIYPGFPSPQLPNDSGLVISQPPDVLGSSAVDGWPFKLKVSGVIANPGAGNVTITLYQVAFAQIGVIGAAGSVTTGGVAGTGASTMGGTAFTTPANPSHFWLEYVLLWDSKAVRLDGYVIGQVQATPVAQTATTAITSGVATVNQLNFQVAVTFATGNAGNSLTLNQFSLERY